MRTLSSSPLVLDICTSACCFSEELLWETFEVLMFVYFKRGDISLDFVDGRLQMFILAYHSTRLYSQKEFTMQIAVTFKGTLKG